MVYLCGCLSSVFISKEFHLYHPEIGLNLIMLNLLFSNAASCSFLGGL